MSDLSKKVDIKTCSDKEFYEEFDNELLMNLWHGLLHYNSALREYWECLEEIEKVLSENIAKHEERLVDGAAEPSQDEAADFPAGVQGHLSE